MKKEKKIRRLRKESVRCGIDCMRKSVSNCPRVLRNTNYANEKGTHWKNARRE